MAMEVRYLSSSAITREHYNLVQSVERATNLQQVDDLLFHKVEVVRMRLGVRHPPTSEFVESLVLLLYCWTATTLGRITRATLEFALPHAVTLTETGSSIKQKRMGYLFCMEIMRKDDELQIMLVNTLRKDLEDSSIPRICLALDALLLNCPEDAIPAVTPRLIDLLAHDSPHVKRKTLAVIRHIGLHEGNILSSAKEKISLRLKDASPHVVSAALSVLGSCTRSRIITSREALNMALQALIDAEARKIGTRGLQIKCAEVVRGLLSELPADNSESEVINRIIQTLYQLLAGAADTEHALVIDCFRALSACPPDIVKQTFSSNGSTLLSILRGLLSSPKPNVQYVCISCLLALDSSLWAGTTQDIPTGFDEGQVNTIMGFLDAPDNIIRKKTLQLLHRVDSQILALHLSQILSTFQSSADHDRTRIAERILEASAVHDTDGEEYAGRLRDITVGLEVYGQDTVKGRGAAVAGGAALVSENVVEQVLMHLRRASQEFCRVFVDAITRILISDTGPTLTLVLAASSCEYGALSGNTQEDLLRGLAGRLETNPPAIQEALLLAMLRITARCASSLPDVSDQVRSLHGASRSHIRRRCEQYLSLSEQMPSLKRIAASAKSDTLPDFLWALETMEVDTPTSPQMTHSSPTTAEATLKSRSPTAVGKLRYEAYDPPRPAPKLTHRRSSTASIQTRATSSRSGRSDSISSSQSPRGRPRRGSGGTVVTDDSEDGLSRTLTAGDLALVAHEPAFARSTSTSKAEPRKRVAEPRSPPLEDLMTKADLIALDSPFLMEPSQSLTEGVGQASMLDFQGTWDTLRDGPTSRGWYERNPEDIKRRFEAMSNSRVTAIQLESQPYQGEIKIIVSSLLTGLLAAIRLRPGEEGSTLWQLRCLDDTMRTELRSIIEGG